MYFVIHVKLCPIKGKRISITSLKLGNFTVILTRCSSHPQGESEASAKIPIIYKHAHVKLVIEIFFPYFTPRSYPFTTLDNIAFKWYEKLHKT